MDALAQYVIIGADGVELYVNPSGADTLDTDIFWGPDRGLAMIRSQDPTDQWHDEVWCQAAVVVDIAKTSMLIFINEMTVVARTAYLDLLRAAWPGWTVRWANDRLAEVLTLAGVDPATVISPLVWDGPAAVLEPASDFVAPATVVTVHTDQTEVFFSTGLLIDVLSRGSELAELAGGATAATISRPRAGLHLEVDSRTLWFWSDDTTTGLLDALPERWPGWTLRNLNGDASIHVELAEDAIQIIEPDTDDVLADLVDRLVQASVVSPDGDEMRAHLARALAAIGKTEAGH